MPTDNKGYNTPPNGWFARGQLGSRFRGILNALDVDMESPEELNLLPEGEQTGLVADAAGVQYTAVLSRTLTAALVNSNHDVFLVAATSSSAGDETVEAQIVDESDGTVVDSVAITGGGQGEVDVTAALPADQAVHVEFNVTGASATGGATFDAHAALLVIR